jgi:hypothetical protein
MDVTALRFGFAVSTSAVDRVVKQRKEDVVLANSSAQHVLWEDAGPVGINVHVRHRAKPRKGAFGNGLRHKYPRAH